MEVVSDPNHVIGALGIFLLGCMVAVWCSRRFQIPQKWGLFLYVWHTIWCLVYLAYVLQDGGDALTYYGRSAHEDFRFDQFGTYWVISFTKIFSDTLQRSLLELFLIFNIIGSVGLLAFSSALHSLQKPQARKIKLLSMLVVLSPSVSFWSSAIGKDAISFMAVGLMLWSALNLRSRSMMMTLAIAAMFVVRPHMAAIMICSVMVAFGSYVRLRLYQRVIYGAAVVSVALVMVPFALQYAGVGESPDADAILSYVETRQSYNMEGGGGVDIASMSLPMKLVTYMFRPFVFEASSIVQMAASLDNALLLFILSLAGWVWMKRRRRQVKGAAMLWLYVMVSWLVLAMTTANLGIAMRQKWMFVPVLIFLALSLIGRRRTVAYNNHRLRWVNATESTNR